jgi:hypothetical protein
VTILASSHTVSALQAPPVTISASPRPLGFLAFTWPYGDTLRFSCTTRFTSVALWFSRSTALGRSLTPPTALTIDFSRIFSQTRWWRLGIIFPFFCLKQQYHLLRCYWLFWYCLVTIGYLSHIQTKISALVFDIKLLFDNIFAHRTVPLFFLLWVTLKTCRIPFSLVL